MRKLSAVFAVLYVLCGVHGVLPAGQDEGETQSQGAEEQPVGEARDESEKEGETPEGEGESSEDSKPRWPEKEIEFQLSLLDAVRIAFENNLDIRISESDHRTTYHDLGIELAAFDPFFSLGFDFGKNRRPTASFLDLGPGGVIPTVQVNPTEEISYNLGFRGLTPLGTNYSLTVRQGSFDRPAASGLFGINPQVSATASVQLTQPLLRGAGYWYNTAGIELARNNRRLSLRQLEQMASETVYVVEQAYWQLLFSLKNYESKTKALEVSLQDLENARKRRDVGTLAPIDVTIVESQAALRKVEFNDAEELLEDSRDSLLDLINHSGRESLKTRWEAGDRLGPYDRILVIPTTAPDSNPLVPGRSESLELAFDNRSDYMQTELELKNQRVRVEIARKDIYPRLDVVGGWEQAGLDDDFDQSFSSLDSGKFYSWSLGVQFEIPIPNRAPREAHHRAVGQLRSLQLRRNQIENRIVIEVDQSLRKLKSLQKKVQDLDERTRLQEAILDAERKKLRVGKSISYTVSTIENDLIDSQAQALRAKADYQSAKAEYYRATGTLLKKRQILVGP